ncbi:MAG: hypothetical protein NT045_06305, partial [Candidatus Aureabacteria bacterium]|nr:hypothetical protein [Candidatus Auribacterota bacterium]
SDRSSGYGISRDSSRIREEIESAAERQRLMQKRKYTQDTFQKYQPQAVPQGSAGTATGNPIQDRLILIQTRINKLESDKSNAAQQGKSPEEIAAIDTELTRLRQQVSSTRSTLGQPPQ